jgi:hypothetical protein
MSETGVMKKPFAGSVPPGFDGLSGRAGERIAMMPPAAVMPAAMEETRFVAVAAAASLMVPSAVTAVDV